MLHCLLKTILPTAMWLVRGHFGVHFLSNASSFDKIPAARGLVRGHFTAFLSNASGFDKIPAAEGTCVVNLQKIT